MNTDLPKTWRELKARMESNQALPENIEVTCICGQHHEPVELNDDDYKELFRILNGKPQTQSKL